MVDVEDAIELDESMPGVRAANTGPAKNTNTFGKRMLKLKCSDGKQGLFIAS